MTLEREVARHFKETFSPTWPILPVSHNASAGWPDCFVQLRKSTVIAVEFKLLKFNRTGFVKLDHFRPEQAAWFAKWQRNDGLCFLFCGVDDCNGKFLGYIIVSTELWGEWLIVSERRLTLDQMILLTDLKRLKFAVFSWIGTRARAKAHAHLIHSKDNVA